MRFRRDNYKYLDLPEIGTVLFKKSARANRVVIAVNSSSQVVVSVPRFISFKKAEFFVHTKLNWILKHQSKINNKINAFSNIDEIGSDQINDLLVRIDHLSKKHNLNYNKVSVKKMKSRWGSCSQKNNISLNAGLAILPCELRDYIILHELLHTKIKNHGTDFWNELSSIIPNAKYLNKQLNKNYKL